MQRNDIGKRKLSNYGNKKLNERSSLWSMDLCGVM